jgi:Ni/Co efflux regulator RcnB
MRKLILAALAATSLVSVGAHATSGKEVRHDQREVAKDVAQGRYQEAYEDQKELNRDLAQYRRTHYGIYDLPDYVWPDGHTYAPVAVGSTLDNVFWGPNYLLNDYGTYHLPLPGTGREYVRYGNDAVLIDSSTGHVVTVYENFFY